ncbi:MAG: dienelactone hydrolase family protein [Chromatiales bacterium]|jgi:phospholipase/carboxylesterase|nr:dienelactone hydrolase family protein [Chromatiales bacterium]
MHATDFPGVLIEPQTPANAAIIWLHGLGADGHDFEPIVPYLQLPAALAVRFFFPHAPQRAITINNGMRMRAWYDISGSELQRREDEAGVRESSAALHRMIDAQIARGISAERIVLAGFSQGGAIALHAGLRYPARLAGIAALSTYLPLPGTVAKEAHAANRDIPILMVHGSVDTIIPLSLAERSAQSLRALGYDVEWQVYAMAHTVSNEEITLISSWLSRLLLPTSASAPENPLF